jgi:hypothetical protein
MRQRGIDVKLVTEPECELCLQELTATRRVRWPIGQ